MPIVVAHYNPPAKEEKAPSSLMTGTVEFLTKTDGNYSANLLKARIFKQAEYLKADQLAHALTKSTGRIHFARVVNEVEFNEKKVNFQI